MLAFFSLMTYKRDVRGGEAIAGAVAREESPNSAGQDAG